MKTIKLFLDDVRNPPDDTWITVRSVRELIGWIELAYYEENIITHLSLDNDMGENELEGRKVVDYLEEKMYYMFYNRHTPYRLRFFPREITVHSANPVAKQAMMQGILNIERMFREMKDVIC